MRITVGLLATSSSSCLHLCILYVSTIYCLSNENVKTTVIRDSSWLNIIYLGTCMYTFSNMVKLYMYFGHFNKQSLSK